MPADWFTPPARTQRGAQFLPKVNRRAVMLQVDGNGFNQLNAPYGAKVIGDYTGLTPPFGFGH